MAGAPTLNMLAIIELSCNHDGSAPLTPWPRSWNGRGASKPPKKVVESPTLVCLKNLIVCMQKSNMGLDPIWLIRTSQTSNYNVIALVITIYSISWYNHHRMLWLPMEIRHEGLVGLGILRHTLFLTKMIPRKNTILCQSLHIVVVRYDLLEEIKVRLV